MCPLRKEGGMAGIPEYVYILSQNGVYCNIIMKKVTALTLILLFEKILDHAQNKDQSD